MDEYAIEYSRRNGNGISEGETEIQETLNKRDAKYGGMEVNAKMINKFMNALAEGSSYTKLSPMHHMVFYMIFVKIARCANGDVNYIDNIHDIIGYATGLEKHLKELEG